MVNGTTGTEWNLFLNKQVKVIYDDVGSQFPRSKEGICKEITMTHLVLDNSNNSKIEAIRLADVRRVEVLQ